MATRFPPKLCLVRDKVLAGSEWPFQRFFRVKPSLDASFWFDSYETRHRNLCLVRDNDSRDASRWLLVFMMGF